MKIKKKILFVLNCMGSGGVAKSLANLLKHLEKRKDEVDVDLFLLKKTGMHLDEVPKFVNMLESKGCLKCFGVSQKESKQFGKCFYLRRFFIAVWTRLFTHKIPLKIAVKQNKLKKHYDAAISFSHTQGAKNMSAGSVEFVLDGVHATKKFCVLHGDVVVENLLTKSNVKKFKRFDKFFSVAKSSSEQVVKNCPQLAHNSDFLYNTQDNEAILKMGNERDVKYNKDVLNMITISRLEKQKAHMRFLSVIKRLKEDGLKFHYHVIGGGILKEEMQEYINQNNLSEYVTLYGVQKNPYVFLKNADLFVLPSYYEAAPMVYGEAMLYHVPVFTTNIISANELVGDKGFVCENDEESIYASLKEILTNSKVLKQKKEALKNYTYDNDAIVDKLLKLI